MCLRVHAEEEIYKGKHAPSKEHPRNAEAVLVPSAPSTLTRQKVKTGPDNTSVYKKVKAIFSQLHLACRAC